MPKVLKIILLFSLSLNLIGCTEIHHTLPNPQKAAQLNIQMGNIYLKEGHLKTAHEKFKLAAIERKASSA